MDRTPPAAAKSRRRSAPSRFSSKSAETALNLISIGVMMADGSHISFANEAAKRILQDHFAFDAPRTRLDALPAKLRGAFDSATRWMRHGQENGRKSHSKTVSLTDGDGPALDMTLIALAGDGDGAGRFLVYLFDHAKASNGAAHTLMNLYHLTEAEARLTMALIREHDLAAAAAALGITTGTARQHLKHVFKKTKTTRQGNLIRLVLTGPAGMLMNI